MATATPSVRRGPRRRRSSTPGFPSWTRSHPPPASVLPESAARKVSAPVRRAHIPDTYAASGPESATWKDPDPRRRSSRGSGLRTGLPARRWRLRDACGLSRLNDFLALWSQAYMSSCNPQVTSTSIHMANQARLAFLAVTHRYKRTHCLWHEQFQTADSVAANSPAEGTVHHEQNVRFWITLLTCGVSSRRNEVVRSRLPPPGRTRHSIATRRPHPRYEA